MSTVQKIVNRENLLKFILVLLFFAAGIKNLREPDLFWQVRTGEWIIDNGAVPTKDIFSYTNSGKEWINVKWGFEVVAALISRIAGIESVSVLQGLFNILILLILYKWVNHLSGVKILDDPLKAFAFAITLIALLMGAEYRMTGRPEMISHLFSLLFVYLLMKYRNSDSKKIFWLIPVQLVWANSHEAFGMGLVIIYAFLAAAFLENRILKHSGKSFFLNMILLSVAATAVIIINPHGLKLLLKPLDIFGQVHENKFTTELLPMATHAWWKKEAWIAIGFLLIFLVHLWFVLIKRKKNISLLEYLCESRGIAYLILVAGFIYLAAAAYRNIIFLSLLLFPFVFAATGQVLHSLQNKIGKLNASIFPLALIVSLLFYALIVSNTYYEITKSRDRFGLETLSTFNPSGAADFIEKNNLKQSVCFSDYLTSSYLLWKLQPDFRTNIDLRDLDVFSQDQFHQFFEMVNYPPAFHKADTLFDYVVLYRPQFESLHRYLYNDSIYACTFVDPVAAVYEKTDSFSRDDIFRKPVAIKGTSVSGVITKCLNPWYKPYNYSSVDYDYLAANYYLTVGRYDLAEQRALKSISGIEPHAGYEMIGQLNYHRANNEPDQTKAAVFLDEAEKYFSKAISLKNSYQEAYMGLGVIQFRKNDFRAAVNSFSKAADLKDDAKANMFCAESYLALAARNPGKSKELRNKALGYFLEAEFMQKDNLQLNAKIGFTLAQLGECKKALKYLRPLQENPLVPESDKRLAAQYLKNCGY